MMEFLLQLPFLGKLFRPRDDSRQAARERLRSALVADRSTLAPGLMRCLEKDIALALSKYMDIDPPSLELHIGDKNGSTTFTTTASVLRIHRQAKLPQEAVKAHRKPKKLKRQYRRKKFRSTEGSVEVLEG